MKFSIILLILLWTVQSDAGQSKRNTGLVETLKTKEDVKNFVDNICTEFSATKEYEKAHRLKILKSYGFSKKQAEESLKFKMNFDVQKEFNKSCISSIEKVTTTMLNAINKK